MVDGKTRWKNRGTKALATVAIALVAYSCSESPTETNSPVAPLPISTLLIRDTTIGQTASSTYRQYTPMDGNVNLVGRSGNYVAYTLLQFYSSYFPERDTAVVYSAQLSLRAVYWFGDPTAHFSFNVYRVSQSWSQSTFTWDSLLTGFYDASSLRGSYTGGAAPDTQQIVVNLDTTMVREWLQASISPTTNYGIILIPDANTNIVRGMHEFDTDSVSFYPTLQIIAGNAAGTALDTTTYTLGMDTFVGNIDNLAADPTLVYAQAGVVYRSTMNFDVSFIPRGALINSAELQLDRQPEASRVNRFTADTVVVAHLVTASGTPPSIEPEASSAYGRRKEGTPYTFSFDTRHLVQSWVRGPNNGLVLRVPGIKEYSSFELYAFCNGFASTPAQRPRLRIVYSTKKN